MASQRARSNQHRALAADGVRAYLRDEDADLYNITEAAVAEDALAAAWNLTALAAAAITMCAERLGQTPEDVLDEVVARGYGGLVRVTQPRRNSVSDV